MKSDRFLQTRVGGTEGALENRTILPSQSSVHTLLQQTMTFSKAFLLYCKHDTLFFFSATCSVESLNKERAQIFVPECWAHCVSIGAPWGVAYERLLMVAGILPQSIFTSLPFSNESNGKQKLASQSWTPLIYGQKDLNRVIHFPGLVQNIWCYKFLEMIVHPRVLQKYNLYLQKWPSNEQEMKASCSSSVTLPCFTDVS